MGIFDGFLGNASEVDLEKVETEMEMLLTEEEKLENVFKIIRDLIVFTNKRLVFVDKQGVTGKKTEYHSIPYRSITTFSVETAGSFDIDSELKIWISGIGEPIIKEFKKGDEIHHVHRVLAAHVL
ncbi:PH domain-containing protein [Sediminibacillus massiliensis]|uniref:PH domain-containing protein n=1 Tax=Sediminibacillus massiliensis TaxID=1926277 RepID=UPI000988347C|nr:PH domain-containing protein [Sediminibacillus massiliensis]